MSINSYLIDSLKLLIKDKYNISDKDLKSLSDIILKYDLRSLVQRGTLINLLYFMDKRGLKFPISYNYMKEEWEKDNLVLSFNFVLSEFIKAGLISLRRLTEATFFSADNITKSETDVRGLDYYIVIYGTKKYNEFREEINNLGILSNIIINVQESTVIEKYPKKYDKLFNRLKNDLKLKYMLGFEIESFSRDEITKEDDLFMIIKIGNVDKKELEINRLAKKFILKDNMVKELDVILDKEEIVLNLKIDSRATNTQIFRLGDKILMFIESVLDIEQ